MATEPKSIMDHRTSVWIVFIVIVLVVFVNSQKLRLCIVESSHTAARIHAHCPKLSFSPVSCVTDVDRFGCLRQLIVGTADFALLEPEDLVVATAYNEYDILVTNELRAFSDEKQHFQMVAVVRKNVKHMWDAKGKRFCHPGFNAFSDWTKILALYFDNWIIPRECDPDKTLLENKMYGLSNYFEMVCIAGSWSADRILDNQLKLKYKNLCGLCENPTGCYKSDKYYGRQGALLCLTDNVGDIAWVRLDDTLAHFKAEGIDKRDYNYLCPDGGTRPVEFDKPCIWISKPWPVIVARSQIAEKVTRLMNAAKNITLTWGMHLTLLLENYHVSSVSTEKLETPEDYLRRYPGFMSANNRASCRPSRRVQWCVASNLEDRKCRWLREASTVYGVEPPISCIQQADRMSCVEAVRSRRADIFVAQPEELLQAREKGLKPIVHAMSNQKHVLNRIAAVVKRNVHFNTLQDLKGARACFTGYRSVGWNAFVSLMRNMSVGDWDCSDAKAVAGFFQDSCVFGLNDEDKKRLPANLYSLCKQDGPGDDASTFDCLTSGLADVVFVNLKNVEEKAGNFEHGARENKMYKILCPDQLSVEKEDSCLLTGTVLASVVAHENITGLRREEIYSMLLDMDALFGILSGAFKGQTSAFSLYRTYDANHNVIFPEETHFLQLHGYQISGIRDYNEILEDILMKQNICSVASKSIFCFPKTLILCIAVISISHFLKYSA